MLNVFHVYIVVDDLVVGQSLQRRLETGNFRCQRFTSITALLEQISLLMDGCIVLDDATSALEGLELLAQTRRAKGRFPLVLITTQASADFVANARKVGISNFIEKPFSDDALFTAIHSASLGTTAMAVLAVIQNEARATGECTLSVAQIAERANVGRTKARAAIRLAECYWVVTVEQAPGRRRVLVNRRIGAR